MFLRKWGRIRHHKISSIREYPKACCLSIFKKAQILAKRKSNKVPKQLQLPQEWIYSSDKGFESHRGDMDGSSYDLMTGRKEKEQSLVSHTYYRFHAITALWELGWWNPSHSPVAKLSEHLIFTEAVYPSVSGTSKGQPSAVHRSFCVTQKQKRMLQPPLVADKGKAHPYLHQKLSILLRTVFATGISIFAY